MDEATSLGSTSRSSIAFAFTFGAAVTPLQAQWTQRAVPFTGDIVAAAFDESRSVTVVIVAPASQPVQTWEWDGATWTWNVAAGSPGSVLDVETALVYDPIVGRLLAVDAEGPFSVGGYVYEYRGTSWIAIAPGPVHPPATNSIAAAFDRVRGVVVAQCWAETWEWNGAWTLRTTTGPGRIDNARMEYDWLRQRCVLIGGYRYDITLGRYVLNGGTWEWNGNQWTLASSAYESARVAHATAYDGPRGRVVLYGGHNGGMGGIWIDHFDCQEWTGSGWVPRSAPPIPPGGANPSGGAHLAASLARGSLELFAAAAWELVRPSAATFRHFGAGCAGGSVQPALRLDAGQLAWLGGSLQLRGTGLGTLPMLAIGLSNSTWSGLPLPLPIPGASPCALLVSPDVAHILPVLGGNSITAMPVPNVAALAGLQVFAQVIAAAPSANAAGLLASAGVAVRAGIR